MKKNNIIAAALAICCLAGCSQNTGSVTDESGGSVTEQVPAVSESTGAPTMVAPHFYDVDLPNAPVVTVGESSEEVSSDEPETQRNAHADDTVDKTVENGEVFSLESGATYSVDEGSSLVCSSGGKIFVPEGAELIVNGSLRLDGELELDGGGYLGIGSGGAVYGDGALKVIRSFDDIACEGNCTVKITPPEPVEDNGCTKVGGVLIANKKYSLPEDYAPGLENFVLDALDEMRIDSGYPYEIVSGFRDYDSQQRNFDYWCEQDGYDAAIMYSSPPGHSEHQTGLTMDLDSLEESYGETFEGMWLENNCYKYGFIIRYPQGKEDITGYTYEPWHVRYLGKSTAKLVHDSGLTLEEFLNVSGTP